MKTVRSQIRTDRTSVLIWIQIVWHSDSVPEKCFEKVNFEKKSADDSKSIKIIQRAKSYKISAYWIYSRFYVCICWINVCQIQINISMTTEIKNKDEQTNKLKRKKKKNEMLLDSNPHLLVAKDSLLSIRLSRICDFFIHKSSCLKSKAASIHFTKIA